MLTNLAIRNLFRNRRRSAITLAAIVLGAVGLILFGGYKAVTFRSLRESGIRRLGHLQVYGKGFDTAEGAKPLEYGLTDAAAVRGAIERDPRVKMTAAQITLMGLVSNGEKSETFLATAVEPEKDHVTSSQRIVAGTDVPLHERDAVTIGKGLAHAMHVKPGDYLTLMSMTTTGSLNAMDVRVAGIFMSGVKEYDDRAVKMPLAGAQQLLQTAKIEKLLVFLKETDDTQAVRSDLAALFTRNHWNLDMRDWFQLATFYQQVRALYNGIFGFLGIIVFGIVVFSVANTIAMSVFERTREIGTLMAMGTTRGSVWRLFLLEGFGIGVLGALCGVTAGAALSWLINHGNIMLPPPPTFTEGYPLRILLQPSVLVTAAVISIVTATLSSIVPALKASRLRIVDALGHI